MAETNKNYSCPGCHCGSMFEYRRKMVCLNCGKEYPKALAASSTHTHSYESFADRPLPKVATSAPDRMVRQAQPGQQRTYQQTTGFTQQSRDTNRKKAKNPVLAGLSFFFYLIMLMAFIRGCAG